MNPVFGKQLQRAREIRGISLEEAAHATRMRPAMVEALESGNLEAFPNPAYAKSFLLLYGKYLRLDVKSVAAEIDTGLQMTLDDYQYLAHSKDTTPEPARRGDFARPHSLPTWTPVIALGGITAVVVFGFLLWLNLSRIGDRGDKPLPAIGTNSDGIEPVVAGAQPVKVDGPSRIRKPAAQPLEAAPIPATVADAAPESGPPVPVEPVPVEATTEANLPAVAAAAPVENQAPAPVYPKEPPPPIVQSPPVETSLPPVPTVLKRPQIIGATTSLVPPTASPTEPPMTMIDGVEVRTARVISPAAKIATNDAALLAQVPSEEFAPQTPPPLTDLTPLDEPEVEQDSSPLAKDPNTLTIEPSKKTWLVIRRSAGGIPIYEDYLYPSARPLRLPSGKYFIEVRDADAIELRRAGKTIPYVTGGVQIE